MFQYPIKQAQKHWALLAALISASMLAAAHAFETFGGMAPCALCLHQREVYWVALFVGLIGFALTHYIKASSLVRAIDAVLGVIFLASAAIAFFHSGVELHWWQGLPECVGGGSKEISGDLLGALSKPVAPPSCDKIPWSLFGLSMANWNVIISLCLAAFSLICAFKGDTGSSDFE
ncbi:disulfide bond formation protein B [Pseudaquidulcibacter saccharophilus]|uniref:disulfide bond formation protein B n=1 Tax=Pseudaquidulcibacter saccharophilus TaxID=2831900 RepID=UPI001EFF55C7|nr:disulfide bond formation protein B [Pseudaquidulcibacter saccharophilus]